MSDNDRTIHLGRNYAATIDTICCAENKLSIQVFHSDSEGLDDLIRGITNFPSAISGQYRVQGDRREDSHCNEITPVATIPLGNMSAATLSDFLAQKGNMTCITIQQWVCDMMWTHVVIFLV